MDGPLRQLLEQLVYSPGTTIDFLTDTQVFQILSAAACLILIFVFITKTYLLDYTTRFIVIRNNILFPARQQEPVPEWGWQLAVTGVGVWITYYGICQILALKELESAQGHMQILDTL